MIRPAGIREAEVKPQGAAVELNVRVQGASDPEVLAAARALVRLVLHLWDFDDPDDAGTQRANRRRAARSSGAHR